MSKEEKRQMCLSHPDHIVLSTPLTAHTIHPLIFLALNFTCITRTVMNFLPADPCAEAAVAATTAFLLDVRLMREISIKTTENRDTFAKRHKT